MSSDKNQGDALEWCEVPFVRLRSEGVEERLGGFHAGERKVEEEGPTNNRKNNNEECREVEVSDQQDNFSSQNVL